MFSSAAHAWAVAAAPHAPSLVDAARLLPRHRHLGLLVRRRPGVAQRLHDIVKFAAQLRILRRQLVELMLRGLQFFACHTQLLVGFRPLHLQRRRVALILLFGQIGGRAPLLIEVSDAAFQASDLRINLVLALERQARLPLGDWQSPAAEVLDAPVDGALRLLHLRQACVGLGFLCPQRLVVALQLFVLLAAKWPTLEEHIAAVSRNDSWRRRFPLRHYRGEPHHQQSRCDAGSCCKSHDRTPA
mmetsp:Transcript_27219/g.78259  ORF Transcript_27219/g.78259 Transcript_27219/m.78259 type:complete len:244 (+) Transcript_27219:10-741(+)